MEQRVAGLVRREERRRLDGCDGDGDGRLADDAQG